MSKLTDRQTSDLRVAVEPFVQLCLLLISVLSPISGSTHWSHLVQLMLGVAQWYAKGNQNQMGPGPLLVPAGAGCCLMAAQEEKRVNQATKAWSTT